MPVSTPPKISGPKVSTGSTTTFLTALTINAIVFGAEIGVFTFIRPYFKAIYERRTYVPIPSKRVGPLTAANSFLSWPWAVYNSNYEDILYANGADAYFFVRFLRMMTRVFLPIWVVSWAILLPVTSINTRVGTNTKLELFTMGNIQPDQQARYWAHLVLAYVFTFWIFYNIRLEMTNFVKTRQQFLASPVHAQSVQATTVLVTGIPAPCLTPAALHALFKDLPGGVKRIWINRNPRTLAGVYDRRIFACEKLESAETSFLSRAAKRRLKTGGASKDRPEVEYSDRPMHRLGFLGLIGEKVDSIDWARGEIAACNKLLAEGQRMLREMGEPNQTPAEDADGFLPHSGDAEAKTMPLQGYPAISSAFVTFNRQIAAHMAENILLHHEPYRMAEKYTEVSPLDVIWSNLGINPYEKKGRMLLSYAATTALIVFWSLPVAGIGIISNIHSLCTIATWLAWICKIPTIPLGIISGILPPVMLTALMMLLPIILRRFALFEGIPTRTGVELSLMTRFFVFLVIHSFLVVTISAGIVSTLPELLKNPSSIPSLLSTKLPQASTFFLTYMILQGLVGTSGGFLQIVPLGIYYVKLFLVGSTPRSIYKIKYGARSVAWGTTFPSVTLLVVITLGYSIISPIINGFACFTFFAFYHLYKYLFLWQFEQPPSSDTGGLFFPKAITHLFVGLYIQQICLIGLFFLAQNQNNKPSATPQGALMVVLMAFTFLFQTLINDSYGPLTHALPLSLAEETSSAAAPIERAWTGKGSEAHEMVETKNHYGFTTSVHEIEAYEELPAQQNSGSRAAGLESEEEYGFTHPAASRPQRVVWLPRDRLGLAEEEERACREAGVDVSLRDAEMNEKGKVDITGPPPDLVLVDE
ncbi:hypothetical protein B0H17DRAFT_991245 [Mycena rosella]|uniref:DUF221-domain-containing protein n=1 Tax=Mycena rosella TaxID=1033263 RepID=A0AAD7G7I0_MYCRO|nr:hypothetical protein B0H17DRAFT_991245 [Mycena rosella]